MGLGADVQGGGVNREQQLRELLSLVERRNLALMGLAETRLEREIEEIQKEKECRSR